MLGLRWPNSVSFTSRGSAEELALLWVPLRYLRVPLGYPVPMHGTVTGTGAVMLVWGCSGLAGRSFAGRSFAGRQRERVLGNEHPLIWSRGHILAALCDIQKDEFPASGEPWGLFSRCPGKSHRGRLRSPRGHRGGFV